MRPVALGALLLAACTTMSGTDSVDRPPSDPASMEPNMVVGGQGAPATAVVAGPARKSLPYNCQAPLRVIEEVSRLMAAAGTHATESSACVDGPGRRVTIDEILVCPRAPDGARRTYAVDYRVTTWPEGGRQVCGSECPPVVADETEQQLEVVFVAKGDTLVLEPPASIPGLPLDATPLTQEHDGDCYGKTGVFVPLPIVP